MASYNTILYFFCPHTPEEIIASVKKGIYCISFANGQVNIGGGDFAFYVKHGYLIEDGKLTQPIKDANIIIDAYFEIFEDVEAAIQREKLLKTWKRAWKIRLIEESNPNWDNSTSVWFDVHLSLVIPAKAGIQ